MRWLLMTTGCPHTEEVGREVYPPTRFWFLAWFFPYFLALRLGWLLLDISVPICGMGMIPVPPNRVIV